MKKYLFLFFLLPFILFSQEKTLNSQDIAKKHFNSIVKVLLIDSTMEKMNPGKGFYGRGSGFFVTEDGLIFTNRHVAEYALGVVDYAYYDENYGGIVNKKDVYDPEIFNYDLYKINYISKMSIIVQVFDKPDENSYKLYQAKLLSIDKSNYDGAILKITSTIDGKAVTEKFNPVIIGNSDSTSQGENLYVYGFPKEYDGDYTATINEESMIKSGTHGGRDYNINKDYGLFKTDIPINSGNSGGPVFNSKGEVIGIATAASNKTGNGFISKINGMYNLAKNDFSLQNTLTLIGVNHTYQNSNTDGVVSGSSVKLPGWDRYNRYNLDQKYTRQFYGGFWFLKAGVGLLNLDEYAIGKSNYPFIQTDFGKKYNDRQKQPSFFIDFGKVFSLVNFNDQHKLSIDWSIINFSYSNNNWSGVSWIKDDSLSIINYNTNQVLTRVGSKLGISYSAMMFKRCQVDIYYKFGFYAMAGTSKSSLGTYQNNGQTPINYNEDAAYTNSFGMNIHVLHVVIGVEYNYGATLGGRYEGVLNYNQDNMNFQAVNVDSKTVFNNLHVCLAVPLYNKKRWQKFSYE